MMTDLLSVYTALYQRFGEQHWWPAETPFEVCVGAILTQSTSWGNVEKAIDNLKREELLTSKAMDEVCAKDLAVLIRPAGYFNSKARKLKALTTHLSASYGDDLDFLFKKPIDELREELLSVWGIGPETADSIILYAAEKPSFVVDAYTKRVFFRLGLVKEDIEYEPLKRFCEKNLPKDPVLYNEFHALIVRLGKDCCRKSKPLCKECPLSSGCKASFK